MIYYLIRHKESGKFMPLMRRGKGYSHWNPGNPKAYKIEAETHIPRLLEDEKHAKRVIVQWNAMPNAHYGYRQTYDGSGDYEINIEDDGRKKEDLEIVKVNIMVEK